MNLSDHFVQGQKPTLLVGGFKWEESGELNDCEGRYIMHAHLEDSKSWHEEHVVKSDGEHGRHPKTDDMVEQCAKVARRLSELQRNQQAHQKKLVAAITIGLKDKSRTIGWLSSTAVGISCEEEPNEWTTEYYDNIYDNIL